MSEPSTDDRTSSHGRSTVALGDDRCEVTQSAIRHKDVVRNSAGTVVLRGKQKLVKLKEAFPFVDGDGEDAFTVKAGGIADIAGNYAITDAGTGGEVVVLDENLSPFVENWTVRDSETGEPLATIRSETRLLAALRHLVSAANLVSNTYEICDVDGAHVGDVEGQLPLRDGSTVTIDDAGTVPTGVVVAAACVLDALENQ